VLAVVFGLGSSLCWGVSDFVGGLFSRRMPLLSVLAVTQLFGLLGNVIVVVARGDGPPHGDFLLVAGLCGIAGVTALAAFYQALAIGTMSIVAPISATGAVVPVAVGLAGGDRPSVAQLLGIVAAVVGVVLASREPGEHAAGSKASRASVGLALVAAVGFGTYFTGMHHAARPDVWWALLSSRLCSGVLLAAVFLAVRPRVPAGRRDLEILALAGLVDLAATGMYGYATHHGLLSVVGVLASLYPAVTVLLARTFLHERIARVQEVGVLSVLAGVALIAAG
jgi:drug/metabolite transporter (DMT)-like permease